MTKNMVVYSVEMIMLKQIFNVTLTH